MQKTLTKEIHNKSPCGISIKNTQEYFSIKEKYSSLMLDISSKTIKTKTNIINNVKNDIVIILENKSKDLELFLWLTYLCIMLKGIDGLVECLEIFSEIIEKYFETIHPIKTEYTDTKDEIIQVKINLINQIDLKTSRLINEHTYIDTNKSINLTYIIQFKNNENSELKKIISEYNNNCIEILEKIEKAIILLENISLQLLQYENYHNNQEIKIPKFENAINNFNNIKANIQNNISKQNNKDNNNNNNNSNTNVQTQTTKLVVDNIQNSNKEKIIEQILYLNSFLANNNCCKITAYAIEFCILQIPQDTVEIAKIIRKNNIIANFIHEVIKFKDNSFDKDTNNTNNNIDEKYTDNNEKNIEKNNVTDKEYDSEYPEL